MNTNTLIDIDDYDDDSKELLQSLINSNSFINLNQPYAKTNYYDVEKKSENPLISPKYLKYGIDEEVPNSGRNLLLEGLASKFIYTGKDINNQDTFAYNVSVEYCENGIEVYEKFKKNNSKDNAYQLNVYIEKVNSSNYFNFSGQSILVYIGDAFYQNILKKFPNQSVSLFYANETKGFTITSLSLIPEYLYNICERKKIDVTKEHIMSAFNTAYYAKSYETSIFNVFSKLQNYVSEGFYFIAKKLKDCRISESFYDPKNKEYKAIDFNVDSIINSVTSIIDSAYNTLKIIPISPNFKFILKKISDIIKQINNSLKQFTEILNEVLNESLKISRAIFSGFINGFIDLVAFLFDVVGFILGINVSETYQTYAKSVNFIELLENVLNYITVNFISFHEGIFDLINDIKNAEPEVLKKYYESLKTVFSEFIDIPKKVGDKVADVADKVIGNIKELSIYDIAYYLGNIIFEVVVAILLAVFTGGIGNVAKAASGSEKFVQYLRFIGKEFLSSASFGVTDVLQSIKNLFVAFSKACKKGFLGFIEWIKSLLKKERKNFDNKLVANKHLDEYLLLRKKFHNEKLIDKRWEKVITSKFLFPKNLKNMYFKYLDTYPALKKGFNQAEFKTTIKSKGNLIEEIEEFSISGDKGKLTAFGDPPKLPPNTIDVLDDWNTFEKFVEGAVDFKGIPRKADSEIKFIFNFLKKHVDKGDEFVIETKNIFKTCGSCRREFIMLEEYLKSKGKKVKIIVFSDETIIGTARLKEKLKIK